MLGDMTVLEDQEGSPEASCDVGKVREYKRVFIGRLQVEAGALSGLGGLFLPLHHSHVPCSA